MIRMEIWKPGDTIRVRSWESMFNEFGAYSTRIICTPRVQFVDGMSYLCGESVEVPDSYDDNIAGVINIDGWLLGAEMFVGHGRFKIHTTEY